MMYFKNKWNAGPFFYFMDILEESVFLKYLLMLFSANGIDNLQF
jgi:hypothetical protein